MKNSKKHKLPFHFKLLLESFKENLDFVIPLMGLAAMSLAFCALVYFGGKPELNTYILASILCLLAVALTFLTVYTTYSSSLYTYEKKLLSKLGRPAFAKVIVKDIHTTDYKIGKDQDKVETTEDFYIEYTYNYQGQNFESAEYINSKKLYNQIQVDDEVPILVLHESPNVSRMQNVKLRNQLKQNKS